MCTYVLETNIYVSLIILTHRLITKKNSLASTMCVVLPVKFITYCLCCGSGKYSKILISLTHKVTFNLYLKFQEDTIPLCNKITLLALASQQIKSSGLRMLAIVLWSIKLTECEIIQVMQ